MLEGRRKSDERWATPRGGPRCVLKQRFLAVLAAILAAAPAFAAPPGAVISNQATFYHEPSPGAVVTVQSNIVELTAAVVRSPATVKFTRLAGSGAGPWQEPVGPSACLSGGSFVPLADPVLSGGGSVDPASAQDVTPAGSYNLGEPLFVRLDDTDQNVDYQAIDTAVVTVVDEASGDTETIQLTETGLNTGIFAGYVPSARGAPAPGDCVLQGALGSTARIDYTDPADSSDVTQDRADLDPVSVVFDSRTGAPVDGARIELVNAATGAPAVVYGNDGVSQFPSTLTSGSTVTDGAGTSYAFGTGEFRFPVVADGNYRLVVTPAADFAAPSTANVADLQLLPGAPYALGPGSFGNAFNKSGGPSFDVDIPLDPQATALYLEKRTTTTAAAPGDFVRYELTLENTSSGGPATDVVVIDRMPAAMRFVSGSARENGNRLADPDIAADGRTLSFHVASLDAGARIEIDYVVEIVGGRRNQELVNVASALAAGGLISNEAKATILLREDLYRSTGTIIGRVVEGDCSQQHFAEGAGVGNVRVYLEDGRYAVTDEGGRFHFEGIDPGTHVAQLDTFTVPDWYDIVGCDAAPGYAGRNDSQFVKLPPGGLLRADFYLRRKPRPEGRVDIELRNSGTDDVDQVAYQVKLTGKGNVEIDNTELMIMLPDGVHYLPGSMRVDGAPAAEPSLKGQVVSMSIADHAGNWMSETSFVAAIDADVDGELVTRAVGRFDSPMASGQKTPVAETKMIREPAETKNAGYVLDLKFAILSDELSAEDKATLDKLIAGWKGVRDIQISATGHSDSQPIAARNRNLFADNYVLSRARAQAAAAYVAEALDVAPGDIQVEGRGPDDPVASNETAAGRQANRRVEMILSGVRPSKPSFLEVTQPSSGAQITPTLGALPGEGQTERPSYETNPDAGMPASQVEPDIDSLAPGVALLLPAPGWTPAIPSTKLSVEHRPEQTVKVYVNGQPVSPLNFDVRALNRPRTVAVSRWKGVDLVDGVNEVRVVVSNADGSRAKSIRRKLYYPGPGIRGELVPELSTLVADGKTRPVIAVRLYDRAGHPARTGMVGNYRIDAPYRAWWDVENDRKNDLVVVGPREPTYRVDADGITYLELAPTTQSGEATVNLKFERQREQEIRAWLKPAKRDWILVGFAEGTAGYQTLSGNAVAAEDAGQDEGYYDDGRVAFFAKGSIKGEYLLTLAYDSARDRNEARHRFDTVIDPNAYYPLFADTSEQRFEAPSQRKLYVKLEREQFSALFGDFDTGLSVTDLSRYERRFNGLKSEYRGDTLGYTVFAAETDQAFHRDEIRGDGTSGLYRLSTAPIIANSDQVRIEVRDRIDSGQVLSVTKLARFLDYNLDPVAGTIFFKHPVPNRDTDFNPVYIVVEYESASTSTNDVVAGGRGSVRFADDRVEVGVTRIDDGTTGAEADLTGVDLRWQVNEQTLLTAEVASSNSTTGGVEASGSAQSIVLEHNGEGLDLRAYIREVEDDFGLGYQSAADRGFRRVGLDTRARLGERYSIDGEAAWQQNLETGDIRNLLHGQLRYERERFSASVGLLHDEDKFADGEDRGSDLAEIGVSQELFDGDLTLRASGSTALSGGADSTDFPTRTVFGADYDILKHVTLVGEYEQASGTGLDSTMTRLGVRAQPRDRTQINSYLSQEVTEFGPRLFANVGLIQGFQLNDHWTLDMGLDQTRTLLDSRSRQFDPDRELVSGSTGEDYVAAYVGAMYSAGDWSANSRFEHRNADSEQRDSLLIGWYRQPSAGHGLSAGLTLMRSEGASGADATSTNLKVGWAFRKGNQPWSFLDRLDLVADKASLTAGDQSSRRIVNNFNANRRFSAAMQMSLQYAFKYVRSDFDGDGYTGYTDLVGFDLRRGLRDRWDAGISTSIYHSYRSSIVDYGMGIDVGYNAFDNVWLTLGYNIAGFTDGDFSAARYTAQGPYLRFTMKADTETLKRIAGR